MSTETKKKKFSIFRILFFLYLMFVLVWTFFGDLNINLSYRRPHTPYRHKACLSNCRVIMGGIEMYNMDHNEDYISENIPLNPSGTSLEGYYKEISQPDSSCYYFYNKGTQEVFCPSHGSPSVPWNYSHLGIKFDPNKNYSEEDIKELKKRSDLENKRIARKSYINNFPVRFIYGLFDVPLIIIVCLLFFEYSTVIKILYSIIEKIQDLYDYNLLFVSFLLFSFCVIILYKRVFK